MCAAVEAKGSYPSWIHQFKIWNIDNYPTFSIDNGSDFKKEYIDGLAQDCTNSSALVYFHVI